MIIEYENLAKDILELHKTIRLQNAYTEAIELFVNGELDCFSCYLGADNCFKVRASKSHKDSKTIIVNVLCFFGKQGRSLGFFEINDYIDFDIYKVGKKVFSIISEKKELIASLLNS